MTVMKKIFLFVFGIVCAGLARGADRADSTVILDDAGVANLGLEYVEADEETFRQTVFALGRIDILPGSRAVVSSRIEGRAVEVLAVPDRVVGKGELLLRVESRQPGDPPPVIELTAPSGGTVTVVNSAVGQPVAPSDSLVEIVDLSVVHAVARVPEHLAGKLEPGQVAAIVVPAFPDREFEAELAHLGAMADAESGTVEAVFHVANADLALRPGMRAEFSIVVGRRDGVIAVPRSAVQGDVTGRFVYVKDYELKNAFVKSPVTLGEQNARSVEILTGLFPGDEVVTKGAYPLAFAGKGSVSLKEALDAAHGHAHNEDGSEMTSEQRAAAEGGHGHDHGEAGAGLGRHGMFFAGTSLLLLVLLVLSLIARRTPKNA